MERFKAQLHTLWQAILMPEILLPAAFIFLWQVGTLPLLCMNPHAPSPDMNHCAMDTPEIRSQAARMHCTKSFSLMPWSIHQAVTWQGQSKEKTIAQ